MKKLNENIIERWDSEARKDYYEEAYKRIFKSILHNSVLIKRLMTKEGTEAVGKNKALEEISKAEQFIKDEQKELAFLIEILSIEKIIS